MPPKRNGRKAHMKRLNENRATAAAVQPGPSHEPDSEYEPEPEQDDGAHGGGGGSVEDEEELRSSPELPVSPIYRQRRDARVSWQYFNEYGKGANCCAAVKAVAERRTKRHRDMSDRRALQSEAAMAEQAAKALQ